MAAPTDAGPKRYVSTREAAFIGVGAMVGAGIFSLLGTAAEVAGSAVWLSFALAGGIAALQGYSFAKFGARYPTAGGLLEYVNRAYGEGHAATITSWLTFSANVIVTAMVALSFGSYASTAIADGNPAWTKGFAVLLVIVMSGLNVAGSTLVAKVQSLIVFVVIGILAFFAIVTISAIDPALIAPSTYPSARDIVSGVALTFFAFLGFGVVTFTAKDLKDPSRQLPRAMTIAIGLAAVIYIAVSLGVLGTLGVEKVIAAGPTAIAVAAQPILGDLGFWLMLITALFATSGATNAGLYPAAGLTEHLTSTGQWPTGMSGRVGPVPTGLFVVAVAVIVMVLFFDLSAIASIGSAVALMIFLLVGIAGWRRRKDTRSNPAIILLALAVTATVLAFFAVDTLENAPETFVAIIGIGLLAVAFDALGPRSRRT